MAGLGLGYVLSSTSPLVLGAIRDLTGGFTATARGATVRTAWNRQQAIELADALPISRPAVSRHLRLLIAVDR